VKLNDAICSKAGKTAASVLVVIVTGMLVLHSPGVALGQVEEDLSDPDLVLDDDFSPDENPPSIRILEPAACSEPVTSTGTITMTGIASDAESGIRKVEAFSHSYPFDETFPFRMATPSSAGDWSSWSIPVQIYGGATRILVRATDNSGNENWDEVKIDLGQSGALRNLDGLDGGSSVAFVDPSFTDAAYGVGGFYEFYAKYHGTGFDEFITTDLDLMTADISANPDMSYYQPFVEKVRSSIQTGSKLAILSDMDIHNGVIFGPTGDNAFRVLFLLHNEYVTQQEYDNLKRFVYNGGTLVFIDSNAFYAEVSYDEKECSVTLVKGHDWEFNSEIARRSVSERYEQENREWVGTNYMINALWDPVSFKSVPFNYSHFEENYVNNPDATILHDYDLQIADGYDGPEWHKNATIAAYEMNHGKGSVIGLGIYGQNLAKDPAFLDFFEKVVLSRAVGNQYQVQAGDTSYPVYWNMDSGRISNITADSGSRKLVVTIDGNVDGGPLRLSLPKNLIDLTDTETTEDFYSINDSQAGEVTVLSYDQYNGAISQGRFLLITASTDGKVQQISEDAIVLDIDHERIIEVPLEPGTARVEIYGTYVTPEFGLLPMGFLLACVLASLILFARHVLNRKALVI
jgi:hypothetical protein